MEALPSDSMFVGRSFVNSALLQDEVADHDFICKLLDVDRIQDAKTFAKAHAWCMRRKVTCDRLELLFGIVLLEQYEAVQSSWPAVTKRKKKLEFFAHVFPHDDGSKDVELLERWLNSFIAKLRVIRSLFRLCPSFLLMCGTKSSFASIGAKGLDLLQTFLEKMVSKNRMVVPRLADVLPTALQLIKSV
eukprot:GILK01017786.1.p1 GENE.GILK01017786.1~~GILK01017786.1.p1  ORF type:complete len:189 (-),score=17.95 GILK01017786.1:29-595(-)